MVVVLCCGCFDVLHPGHLRHLLEAKALGDCLIVALAEDDVVNKGPGRPIHPWADRAAMLEALQCVDRVVPMRNCAEAIRNVGPQFYVRGCDYNVERLPESDLFACHDVGAQIRFTKADKMSSAEVIRRVMTRGRSAHAPPS